MRWPALILATGSVSALAQGIVVGPNTKASNTYRWLDGKQRNLGGLRYDGRDLTVVRNVIRFWDEKDSNTVVRNSTFRLKEPTKNYGDLPVALEYVGGHDHLIENVTAEGFYSVPREGQYENGDCFAGERGASRITFRNVTARGCSDGGFDFKSRDVHFENVVAERAGKAFRIWGTATASRITCRDWKDGCVQMNPGTAESPSRFVVDKLALEPGAQTRGALASVTPGTTLTIKSCSGTLPSKLVHWVAWDKATAAPDNLDLTLCGVKVTTKDEAGLRPLIEAQMVKDARPAPAATAAAAPALLCTFPTKLRDGSGDGVIELGWQNAKRCGGKAGMRVRLMSEQPGAFGYGLAN
jgi:hypothetical protein